MKAATDLCRIMAKHGSDKSPLLENSNRRPHDYTPLYDEWFSKWRERPPHEGRVMVLEVGVYQGASLLGWKEYFGWCFTMGLDIRTDRIHPEVITDCWKLDQTDRKAVRKWFDCWSGNFELDIIIDDGLHNPTGAIPFFTEAFPYLKSDGYYIIEDVRPQYLDQTVYAMEHAHPTAEIEVHDLRYTGSKYDNILIVARKPGNS